MTSSPPLTGTTEQLASRLSFLHLGTSVGAWAPLVPFAKERLGADTATMGLLMLCIGLGSLATMPVMGSVVGRVGCRRIVIPATIAMVALLPFFVIASSVPTLALTFLLFGAAMGANDIAMNVQAVMVEKDARRPLLSGFHGMWSVGGIVGAGGVSGLLWLGFSPLAAICAIAVTVALLFVASIPGLVRHGGGDHDAPLFVLPRGIVLVLGTLCGIVFLAEGVVLDWSALFLRDRGMDAAQAGIGYAAFACAMTVCRLTGDRIVAALGRTMILLGGGLVGAAGYALAVLAPWPWLAIVGFTMVGIGASNIVPVLFSVTGRQTVMPGSHAVAAVTTFGYAGVLIGPALIGLVANATSLSFAFVLVALMMLGVAVSARVAR